MLVNTVVLAPGMQELLCLGPQHHILMAHASLAAIIIDQADIKFTYIIVSKRIHTRFFR